VKDYDHTHCRQWVFRPDRMLTDPFGQQNVRVNMHPGYQNTSTIGPSGPVDPDLSILSLQTTNGVPIAVLANYSMHYFGSDAVSADYFGRFCDGLRESIVSEPAKDKPEFVAIMSQGTAGDMHWMDYGKPKTNLTIDGYAAALVKEAHEAYRTIEYRADATLAMHERDLHLRVREPDEQRLVWAKGVVEKMGDRPPKTIPEVYAREAIELHKNPTRDVKVAAIRIGDVGITTISCEVFALTGLKIKAQSPLPHTFNIELANGEDGYIPPAELHPLGGYTTWPARSACLEVGAEEKITETAIALLEEVSGKSRSAVVEVDGAYASAITAAKPSVYWRMSQLTAAPWIDGASGVSTTLEPGVLCYLDGPQSDAFTPGVVNRALHFAGGRLAADVKTLGSSYTVDIWLWNGLPGEARAIAGYLFSRGADGDPAAAGDHLGIGGTFAAQDRLFFYNGNKSKALLAGNSPIKPKTWNHAVMVRDGRRVNVYLNGNATPEISGEADVTLPPGVTQVFLGGRNDRMFGLEGKLDEVAIFDRALSATEAVSRYPLTGFPIAKTPEPPSKPRSPEESLRTLKVKDGFEVQLVAAEPMTMSPTAIEWGPDGKLWIAEMADYPLGVDDHGKAGGRIRFLEDTDGDGKYDKSTLFMEGVNFPQSIMPWRDGVIVTAAPEIFFAADRDGDGKADVRKSLFVGFNEGNTQLRVNGLKWGLDNWVYLANGWSSRNPVRSVKTLEATEVSGRDMRMRPDDGVLETVSGMSEYGRNRDDWGNWFGCDNSHPIYHFVLSERYTRRNPHVAPPDSIVQMTEPNPKVFPLSRGQKRYHSFEQAGHFTSACATMVYRDELLLPRDGTPHHLD
jgi:putative membrane-bound dehydrogenase-like protein